MSHPGKSRWGIVIAGVTILMCLGIAYSWGVFLVPIDGDMGWGRAKISFAVSVLLLVFSVFMVIGGLLEKKFGPRKTASAGGVLVGVGWILSSFSTSPFSLYLSYGVIAGVGTGLSYMPSISSGVKWFPDKKGLVTGIIVFGFGFGTAFLSPVITRSIASLGWRNTMMLFGVLLGAVIITAAQFLKNPVSSAGSQNCPGNIEVPSFSTLNMMKTGTFKIMFVTYFISMVAGMMTIGHIAAYITDRGFTTLQGALALTILSVFNGIGRISFGHASDIWGGKRILCVLFLMIGGAMPFLYHSNALFFIYALSALIGLCFGGFLAVYPALTAEYFGCRDFAVNYGVIFIGYGTGCFFGPLIGGAVYDAAKDYMFAFYFAGFLAVSGALLTGLFVKRPEIGKS